MESGVISWIGHDTHFDLSGIAGAALLCPEGEVQIADAICESGQAYPAESSGAVAVEIEGARTCVVGCAGIGVAVGIVRATPVATVPAGVDVCSASGAGEILKTVGVR